MTQKIIYAVLLIFAGVWISFYAYDKQNTVEQIMNKEIAVLLVYGKEGNTSLGIRAFSSILEEEGVPFKTISNDKLLSADPEKVAKSKSAILYPDHAATFISSDSARWIGSYLKAGGFVQIASDAGSKNRNSTYKLEGGVFDTLAGIGRYRIDKRKRGLYGHIVFRTREVAEYFGIPKGKYDNNGTIVGYRYGALTYTYQALRTLEGNSTKVYAFGQGELKNVPLLLEKSVGKGKLFFVNLPLAYLKGNSDDLIARSVLRTFLFKQVQLPHLVSSPGAKGGLVLNLHIDSNEEHAALPWFMNEGYLVPELKYSIHITAGPDCYAPGDEAGFDANGKGREIVKKAMRYGIIGSHGGWAHDWFASRIRKGELDQAGIEKYIRINNKTLEKITGYPIREYSAPNGVFPQPESVKILSDLGIKSYYYTGDSGSSPNRSFFEGKMLSKEIIAFPVMTYANKASLHEFEKEKAPSEAVEKVLKDVVDYTVRNRIVRLLYTHPYDIYNGSYKKSAKAFINYCVQKQTSGMLKVEPMSYFRDFLLRLVQVQKQIVWRDGKMNIDLQSSMGLGEIVLAIPKHYQGKEIHIFGKVEEDALYYYVPVETNSSSYHMVFDYE